MKRLLVWILAVPLLGGCLLPYESWMPRARLDPPGDFTRQAPTADTVLADGGEPWWEAWNDPGLNAYMDAVLAGNLDIAKAVERYRQFAAQAVIAGAPRRPYLNFLGNAQRANTPGFPSDTTGGAYSFSAGAGYELDLWGRLASTEAAALFRRQASEQDLRALYVTVTAEAADLYFFAVEQRAQLALNKRLVASYRDALDMVRLRYRSGLSPALDVYLAKQNLIGGQAKRPVYEDALSSATHALAVLAGRFPENAFAMERASLTFDRNPVPDVIPATLVRQRPDIAAAYARLRAFDQDIAAAVADRFPRVNLMAALGRSGSDSAYGYITGGFWNIITELAVPIIDGGRRRAEVERRQAQFMEALHGYRQTVLGAFREVEDALSAISAGEQRIKLLGERLEAAEAGFRLARERYTAGLDDYLTVLSSQVIRFDVESQLVAARRELVSARIALLRALGGSWMEKDMTGKLGALRGRARQ